MKFRISLICFLCVCSSARIVNALFGNKSSLFDTDYKAETNLSALDTLNNDNSTSEPFSFLGNLPEESSGDNELEDDSYEDGNKTDDFLREPQNPKEFMDYFADLMERTRERLEELFDQYMPQLLQMSSTVTLSSSCTYDAIQILFGLRNLKPWAIKILDSSGKIPDGILGGTLTALGSYDDCLESKIGEEQNEDSTRGQYCAINVRPYLPPKPPVNTVEKEFNDAADAKGFAKEHHFARIAPLFYFLKLRLGICLPASCTLNDLDLITQRISNRFRVNVTVQSCDHKQSFYMENDQIIPLTVITALLILIVLATCLDVVRRYRGRRIKLLSNKLVKCWLSFSVYTNSGHLLSVRNTEEWVKPLNGMKVISLIWIMLAHTYMTLDFRALGRLISTRELPKGFLFQIVLNASLAIETFFFLSGLVVTYNTLRKMQTSAKWRFKHWIMFYIHRFVRLTPAIVLLIVIFLFGYRLGNGPLWSELIYPAVDKCRTNWWTHALYVSNFIKGKDMCFLHLWYIAADMQLFIFTPIFITVLHSNAYLGQLLLLVSISVSIISTGVVTYTQELPPTLLFNNPDPSTRVTYGNVLFVKPYPHAAPYLIGMMTGHILFRYSHIKLPPKTVIFGWLSAISVILFSVFSTWSWNKGESAPSAMVSVLYASCFRVLWALAMAWIAIACQNGVGGIINSFLSSTAFIPLSKLSYVAYLIHPGMMYIFVASTRNIFAFSHYFVIQLFFSHLTTTFIVSYIFSLIIEYPFISLERVLHTFANSGNYRPKAKLYSIKSIESTASDGAFLDKGRRYSTISEGEDNRRYSTISDGQEGQNKYNTLNLRKPFTRFPEAHFRSTPPNSHADRHSVDFTPSKLVFKL